MTSTAQQDNGPGGATTSPARGNGTTLVAVAELLAWSDAIDRAMSAGRSIGRAMASAECYAELARLREQAERARGEGYAEAIADVKRLQHGIVSALGRAAEAERGRWVVRGEVRTRATFGAPHPDDYHGGPVEPPTAERCAELLAALVTEQARQDRERDAGRPGAVGRAA